MFGDDVDQSIENGHGNLQAARDIKIEGITFEQHQQVVKEKDTEIKQLIEEKTRAAVNAENTVKEKEKFEEELRELKKTHAALQEMMQNPHKAYDAHIKGANELQKVLCDIGTLQALGHNRIQAALDDLKNLNYAAVDQLLQDSERQGILQAARSAFGRGVNAEAAIKFHDAYAHFKRAYELGQGKEELDAYARLCLTLGKYGEAEPMLKKLCEWEKEDFGVNHADYAMALNNLAFMYHDQGRNDAAEPLYLRALEIGRKALGEDHPDYATSLNNIAGLHHAQGRYNEAEPLYGRAMEIRRTALGEDHPKYATSLHNLGTLYMEQGRLDEAAPLLQQALAILEKALPADHPDTQSTREWLDRLYAERPDLRDGAEMS
ncbi:tetratricopeptide repeat protein [Rhodobacteraceae bacterium]|nr:tetratricopeptide repeat protein [Paracoccaceae bacterium]